MTRALQGNGGENVGIVALCGDDFWDALTTCAEVERTYLNWSAAQDLRGETTRAWSACACASVARLAAASCCCS